MASEDFVSFTLMRMFQDNGWNILQYHPPGGQACLAIIVSGEITYPDLIAYKDGYIIVLENKSRYSTSDIEKLRRMIADNSAVNQIKGFSKNYLQNNGLPCPDEIIINCGHGFSGTNKPPLDDINLFCIGENGNIEYIPSKESPIIL